VGGEERWGRDKSGRTYGEYQLETGELGLTNRTVVGMGKRTRLTRSLTIDGGYERSQVASDVPGAMSRDVLSSGFGWNPRKRLKIAGRYELRYEDNDESIDLRDRYQFLTLNSLRLVIHRDWTLGLQFNYSHTFDLEIEGTEAELMEGSIGLAYRPPVHTWIIVLSKYTKRYEQYPITVESELPHRTETDVVSLIPIFELPFNFQLVEKFALKRTATRVDRLPTVVGHSLLWINRLNYHVTDTWDAGVEYRRLESTLAQNALQGALVELNYIIKKKIRLGVGYNFSSFSDNEFSQLDEDHGGPFFRVIGQY